MPELLATSNIKEIRRKQITNLITVFGPDEVVYGQYGICEIDNYFVICHAIDVNQKLTSYTAFSLFVGQYLGSRICFSMLQDIQLELFNLRQDLKEYMQSIMCNSGNKQGVW